MSQKEGHLADDEDQRENLEHSQRMGRGRRISRGRPNAGRYTLRTRRRAGAGSPSTRAKASEEHRREYSKLLRVQKASHDSLVKIKNERKLSGLGETVHFLIERYETQQTISPQQIRQMPNFSSTPVVDPAQEVLRTPYLLPPRELFEPLSQTIARGDLSPIQPTVTEERDRDLSPAREPVDPGSSQLDQTVASEAWEIILPPEEYLDETLPYGGDVECSTDESAEESGPVSFYKPSPPNSSDSEEEEEVDEDEVIQEYLNHVGFEVNPNRHDLDGIDPDANLETDLEGDFDAVSSSESEWDANGIHVITTKEEAVQDTSCLAYKSCMLRLAHLRVPDTCSRCSSALKVEVTQVGSAMYLKWMCEGKTTHTAKRWCSQPRFKFGQHLGDFQLCAGTLFSGNNFTKVATLLRSVNMKPPSESTYTRVHRNHAVPVVEGRWKEVNENVIQRVQEKSIVILGDGRMDSPGFNAQFCTYTFMENDTKDIVAMIIVDKREVGGVSVNMEKYGFIEGLQRLQDKGVKVEEVVTDAHTQISALMKRQYGHIKHSLDVWHGAKNLAKKLIGAGAESECGVILQWVQDISNHFWYCVKVATTYLEFVAKWRGLLHHVCGKHEWLPLEGYGDGQCDHEEIQEQDQDKDLFASGSKAHVKLRNIILDTYFLGKIEKYLNFRTTSELEAFNNKILGFASKRFAFQYPGYRARCFLAGIDYQENKDNMPLMTKEGELRLHRVWRKRSARWDAKTKKQRTFGYVTDLMELAVADRLERPDRLRLSQQLEEGDPRHLASHSAKVPPPPTREIHEAKRSRMQNYPAV